MISLIENCFIHVVKTFWSYRPSLWRGKKWNNSKQDNDTRLCCFCALTDVMLKLLKVQKRFSWMVSKIFLITFLNQPARHHSRKQKNNYIPFHTWTVCNLVREHLIMHHLTASRNKKKSTSRHWFIKVVYGIRCQQKTVCFWCRSLLSRSGHMNIYKLRRSTATIAVSGVCLFVCIGGDKGNFFVKLLRSFQNF